MNYEALSSESRLWWSFIQSCPAPLITLLPNRLRQPQIESAKCWLSTRRTSKWWRTTRNWPVMWVSKHAIFYFHGRLWRKEDDLFVCPVFTALSSLPPAPGVDPSDHPLAGEPNPREDCKWHAGETGGLQRLPLCAQTTQGIENLSWTVLSISKQRKMAHKLLWSPARPKSL